MFIRRFSFPVVVIDSVNVLEVCFAVVVVVVVVVVKH